MRPEDRLVTAGDWHRHSRDQQGEFLICTQALLATIHDLKAEAKTGANKVRRADQTCMLMDPLKGRTMHCRVSICQGKTYHPDSLPAAVEPGRNRYFHADSGNALCFQLHQRGQAGFLGGSTTRVSVHRLTHLHMSSGSHTRAAPHLPSPSPQGLLKGNVKSLEVLVGKLGKASVESCRDALAFIGRTLDSHFPAVKMNSLKILTKACAFYKTSLAPVPVVRKIFPDFTGPETGTDAEKEMSKLPYAVRQRCIRFHISRALHLEQSAPLRIIAHRPRTFFMPSTFPSQESPFKQICHPPFAHQVKAAENQLSSVSAAIKRHLTAVITSRPALAPLNDTATIEFLSNLLMWGVPALAVLLPVFAASAAPRA